MRKKKRREGEKRSEIKQNVGKKQYNRLVTVDTKIIITKKCKKPFSNKRFYQQIRHVDLQKSVETEDCHIPQRNSEHDQSNLIVIIL